MKKNTHLTEKKENSDALATLKKVISCKSSNMEDLFVFSPRECLVAYRMVEKRKEQNLWQKTRQTSILF